MKRPVTASLSTGGVTPAAKTAAPSPQPAPVKPVSRYAPPKRPNDSQAELKGETAARAEPLAPPKREAMPKAVPVSDAVMNALAEEFDPGAGRQTGNFPQALTHIALVNTAHNLSDPKKPVEKPAMQRSA